MADTDILAGHAATKPDKPAVVVQGRTIDFASLNRRANRAANMFLALGCEPDDHVDVVESARSDVRGEVRYIAIGDRVPNGWLDYEKLMQRASEEAPEGSGADGPALLKSMIYTSGTTGHPKGAWRPKGVNLENV